MHYRRDARLSNHGQPMLECAGVAFAANIAESA